MAAPLTLPTYSTAPSDCHTVPQAEDVTDLLNLARSEGDPFHAITLYKKALEAKPEDTLIIGEAAELLLQIGDTSTAKEVFVFCESLGSYVTVPQCALMDAHGVG